MSTGRLRMPEPGALTSNLISAPSSGWMRRISWFGVGAPPAASNRCTGASRKVSTTSESRFGRRLPVRR